LFPPDERLEPRPKALIAGNAIPFARAKPQETRKTKKLKTPDGPITREIVYRDWRVTGTWLRKRPKIVVETLAGLFSEHVVVHFFKTTCSAKAFANTCSPCSKPAAMPKRFAGPPTASSASASVKPSSAVKREMAGQNDEVEEENVDEDQEEGKQ